MQSVLPSEFLHSVVNDRAVQLGSFPVLKQFELMRIYRHTSRTVLAQVSHGAFGFLVRMKVMFTLWYFKCTIASHLKNNVQTLIENTLLLTDANHRLSLQ